MSQTNGRRRTDCRRFQELKSQWQHVWIAGSERVIPCMVQIENLQNPWSEFLYTNDSFRSLLHVSNITKWPNVKITQDSYWNSSYCNRLPQSTLSRIHLTSCKIFYEITLMNDVLGVHYTLCPLTPSSCKRTYSTTWSEVTENTVTWIQMFLNWLS